MFVNVRIALEVEFDNARIWLDVEFDNDKIWLDVEFDKDTSWLDVVFDKERIWLDKAVVNETTAEDVDCDKDTIPLCKLASCSRRVDVSAAKLTTNALTEAAFTAAREVMLELVAIKEAFVFEMSDAKEVTALDTVVVRLTIVELLNATVFERSAIFEFVEERAEFKLTTFELSAVVKELIPDDVESDNESTAEFVAVKLVAKLKMLVFICVSFKIRWDVSELSWFCKETLFEFVDVDNDTIAEEVESLNEVTKEVAREVSLCKALVRLVNEAKSEYS